jgi:hypothetical protein
VFCTADNIKDEARDLAPGQLGYSVEAVGHKCFSDELTRQKSDGFATAP